MEKYIFIFVVILGMGLLLRRYYIRLYGKIYFYLFP